MNANNAWLADVTDLIISDHETAGRPVLPAGARPRLEAALERLLVDRDALHGHIRTLQRQLGRNFRHRLPLSEAATAAVAERGLAALDDVALAVLLLNPVALHAL